MNAVEIEEAISELAELPFDSAEFPYAFLEAFVMTYLPSFMLSGKLGLVQTVRFWWNRFGPLFAAEIRKNRIQQLRAHSNWQWHLDGLSV